MHRLPLKSVISLPTALLMQQSHIAAARKRRITTEQSAQRPRHSGFSSALLSGDVLLLLALGPDIATNRSKPPTIEGSSNGEFF